MIIVRFALSRTSNDRFPIPFRGDCERTLGGGEGLFDLMVRLNRAGYDLMGYAELKAALARRGALY